MIEIAFEATTARRDEIVEQCADAGIRLETKGGSFESRQIMREMLEQLADETLATKDARAYLDMRSYFVMRARDIHAELDGQTTPFIGEVASESEAVYVRARFPEAKAARCVKS